jgi:hypothetical protein
MLAFIQWFVDIACIGGAFTYGLVYIYDNYISNFLWGNDE